MLRELTDDEFLSLKELRANIARRRTRNLERKNLLESKKRLDKVGFSVPPHMIDFQTPLGWAEKATSVPSARVYREGFRLGQESELLDAIRLIFADQQAVFSESAAVESSMQNGCAFLFLSRGNEFLGESPVVVSARSALEASCVVDQRSGVVRSALEMVDKNTEILHLPGVELTLGRGRSGWMVKSQILTGVNMVMCEPVIWNKSLDKPFGRSRITRPLIGAIHRGVRTLLRMEVTAEFFSAPQRALLGASEEHFTDEDGKRIDLWKAITGGVWALPDVWDDEEGKLVRAQLQQLSQASMAPHSDMFNGITLQAAAELQMPISYLGVQHNQPQTEGAIRAEESSMLSLIQRQNRESYKPTFEKLARKSVALMYGEWTFSMAGTLQDLTTWFADPGTPTISARADAALKYTQAFPNGDPEIAMEMYGLSEDQIQRNLTYMRRSQSSALVDRLLNPANKAMVPPVAQDTGVDS